VDSSIVRARQHGARRTGGGAARQAGRAADHGMGRSRGGLSTRIHLACDGHGRPLSVLLTGGNVNDCTTFTQVVEAIEFPRRRPGRPRRRPARVPADQGCSSRAIRGYLRSHGIPATTPERAGQKANRARRGSHGGRPRF
jgi:transposase